MKIFDKTGRFCETNLEEYVYQKLSTDSQAPICELDNEFPKLYLIYSAFKLGTGFYNFPFENSTYLVDYGEEYFQLEKSLLYYQCLQINTNLTMDSKAKANILKFVEDYEVFLEKQQDTYTIGASFYWKNRSKQHLYEYVRDENVYEVPVLFSESLDRLDYVFGENWEHDYFSGYQTAERNEFFNFTNKTYLTYFAKNAI